MYISYALPHARLRGFIANYWFIRLDAPDGLYRSFRLSPTPAVQLLLHDQSALLYENSPGEWFTHPRASMAGVVTRTRHHRWIGTTSCVGIDFHPQASASMVSMPMAELTDNVVDARLALRDPGLVGRIRGELETCASIQQRVHKLDACFSAYFFSIDLPGNPVLIPVGSTGSHNPHPSVRQLAGDLGMSTRHFNRLFQKGLGLRPKTFLRIQRFRSVLWQMHTDRGRVGNSWPEMARKAGYADHPHLIREFREFTDHTPTAYMAHPSFRRDLLARP